MVKKKILAIILSLLFLFSFGCGFRQSALPPSTSGAPAPAADTAAKSGAANSKTELNTSETSMEYDSSNKKIIKNAEMSFGVENTTTAETKVQELVVKYQGFVQSSNTYGAKEATSTDMVVRIPADKFDSFTGELKSLGEVTQNKIYTTDVTEEYIDLAARQKNLKLQEERLQEMLKKSNTVDEMLKVEKELARVREEIEKSTGKLKYLENRISYSTATIHLRNKYVVSDTKTNDFSGQLVFNLRDGLTTFLNFLTFLLMAVIWLLPFIVIGVPLFIFIRKRQARRRENKRKKLEGKNEGD